MEMTEKKGSPYFFFRIASLIIVFFLASGCSSNSGQSTADAITTPSSEASPIPAAIIADGWSQLLIQANWAKIRVDSFAHWTTSRNACGKDADGALNLPLWNRLVSALNHASVTAPLSEPRCHSHDSQSKMDGTAELTLNQGKRVLLEARDSGEICTTIRDEAESKKLLEAVQEIILIADQEDCPLGWGH